MDSQRKYFFCRAILLLVFLAVVSTVMRSFISVKALSMNSFTESQNTIDFAGGNGSKESPFLISEPIHLDNIRNYLGDEETSYYFLQTNDIDIYKYIEKNYPQNGWKPIGEFNSQFCGKYIGDGFKISGVWARAEMTSFFGYCFNVLLDSVNIVLDDRAFTASEACAGLAVNFSYSTALRCSVNGKLKGDVVVSNADENEDYWSVPVINIGGLFSTAENSKISESYYKGEIYIDSNLSVIADEFDIEVAGISSYSMSIDLENCYADFYVEISKNLINNQLVNKYVGGLLGSIQFGKSVITDSYAVIESVSLGIQPFVGVNREHGGYLMVEDCYYNASSVESFENDGIYIQNYQSQLSNDELKKSISFKKLSGGLWDFNNIWIIDEGKTMPFLRAFNIIDLTSQGENNNKTIIVVLSILGSIMVIIGGFSVFWFGMQKKSLKDFFTPLSNAFRKKDMVLSSAEVVASIDSSNNILPEPFPETMTKREVEIAKALLCGKTREVLAKELFISERTLNVHIDKIYKKTGVTSRTEFFIRYSGHLNADNNVDINILP